MHQFNQQRRDLERAIASIIAFHDGRYNAHRRQRGSMSLDEAIAIVRSSVQRRGRSRFRR